MCHMYIFQICVRKMIKMDVLRLFTSYAKQDRCLRRIFKTVNTSWRTSLSNRHIPNVQQVRQRKHLWQFCNSCSECILNWYQKWCCIIFLFDEAAARWAHWVIFRNDDADRWNARQMLIVQAANQFYDFCPGLRWRVQGNFEFEIQSSDFSLQDVGNFKTITAWTVISRSARMFAQRRQVSERQEK